MCACIAQLKPEQQHNMSKLLASWRTEQVVPGSIINACQDKLPVLSSAAADADAAAAGSPPPAPPAANGGYTGASQYVQAMAAAAVAAAAAAQGKQLTPSKRVSTGQGVGYLWCNLHKLHTFSTCCVGELRTKCQLLGGSATKHCLGS